MSNVNQELVKIYFEMNGFMVKLDEHFFIFNLNRRIAETSPNFVLQTIDLPSIERATVEVKGWHTGKFFPSVLNTSPQIFDFVQPEGLQAARDFFQGSTFKKILVVSGLPAKGEVRTRSIKILEGRGIDHILEFSSVLNYIIHKVRPNKNYQDCDLLQLIRLLKCYRLLKEPQLELFKR